MPQRPLKPCRHRGCRTLSRNSNGYCDDHKDEAKAWVKKPVERSGRGGRPWRRLREQVLVRDGYLCQCDECKARAMPLVANEVDHIIPLAHGGTDALTNLMAINHDCHKRKTAADSLRGRLGRG